MDKIFKIAYMSVYLFVSYLIFLYAFNLYKINEYQNEFEYIDKVHFDVISEYYKTGSEIENFSGSLTDFYRRLGNNNEVMHSYFLKTKKDLKSFDIVDFKLFQTERDFVFITEFKNKDLCKHMNRRSFSSRELRNYDKNNNGIPDYEQLLSDISLNNDYSVIMYKSHDYKQCFESGDKYYYVFKDVFYTNKGSLKNER